MGIDAFKNKTFRNIVIMPTIRLSSWSGVRFSVILGLSRVFSGGPIYPKYAPRYVRQCIGIIPIVLDECGESAVPVDTIDKGVWCGHVYRHFGHMVADFSTRIAVSAARHPDRCLLFTVRRDFDLSLVPDYFWGILNLLGAKKENVRFINEPVLVKELTVYAQAERRYYGKPSQSYLNLLNSLRPPIEKCYSAIYFSRGNYLRGGIAGERYLEDVMGKLGVLVVRPEEYPLEKQIEFCLQAEKLLFAEGSAVYLLQLLGTGVGDVVILNRRTSILHANFFCRGSVSPRARTLRYINSIEDVVFCKPEIMPNHGITILKTDRHFFYQFKKCGFNIEAVWDVQEYIASRNQDIINWFGQLPISIWGNKHFHKKVEALARLSSEIKEIVTVRTWIFPLWKSLKQLGIFDEITYLARNPDVKDAGVDALEHYLKYGWKEGRDPSPYFDLNYYIGQFPDGYNGNIDPLSHYLCIGWKNGLNPNPEFNVKAYLDRYPEVKFKNLEPLQHYVGHGQFLGYPAC